MDTRLTDTLCTRCGLCCDGSLLADVELTGSAEAARAEILGLRVDDDSDEPVMLLPCSALKGTRCSVYAHRPGTCRSFACALLTRAQRGTVSVDQALVSITEARMRIGRVKRLLAGRGGYDPDLPLREACTDALAAGSSAELETATSELQELLERVFLSGPARS